MKTNPKTIPNGIILFEGPSLIDGQPIVVIATGIKNPSSNVKTGKMIQTWIMRSDIAPTKAHKLGLDISVCGDCPHRKGTCYVTLFHAPLGVYKAYKRGSYTKASDSLIRELMLDRKVRIGAYGDPGAVPFSAWEPIIESSKAHTGYTHQWKTTYTELKSVCMASCDNENDYQIAQSAGWRTFRVKSPDMQKRKNEVVCPASDEGGNKLQCIDCLACSGGNRKSSIVIDVHGTKRNLNAFNLQIKGA